MYNNNNATDEDTTAKNKAGKTMSERNTQQLFAAKTHWHKPKSNTLTTQHT